MKCVLLIHESQADMKKRHGPDAPAYWAGWMAYTEKLTKAGVMAGGAGLELPDMATLVKIRSGQRSVQEGPYSESKEQLGGFYILEVPSLDDALAWAAQCPAAPDGTIEVRPTLVMPD